MPSRILASGQSLGPDQTLESANRRYSLTMQADGNLVLSELEGGARWPRWASSSYTPGSRATMQANGELVIHGPGGEVCWSNTHTGGNPGAFLMLQNDGDATLYRPGKRLWSTQTASDTYNQGLLKNLTGEHLKPDESLLASVIFDQFMSPATGYSRYISAVTSTRLIVAPENLSSPDPSVIIEFSRAWSDIAEIDYRPRQGEGYVVSTSGGKWPILGFGMIPPPNYDEFIAAMRRHIQ
jgi:hypothetical protein